MKCWVVCQIKRKYSFISIILNLYQTLHIYSTNVCSIVILCDIFFVLKYKMVSTRRSFVDEREDIQKKAFTKWINNQLTNVRRFISWHYSNIYKHINSRQMQQKLLQIYFKIYVMELFYFDYSKSLQKMNMYVIKIRIRFKLFFLFNRKEKSVKCVYIILVMLIKLLLYLENME